jgi:hypothetical protein
MHYLYFRSKSKFDLEGDPEQQLQARTPIKTGIKKEIKTIQKYNIKICSMVILKILRDLVPV